MTPTATRLLAAATLALLIAIPHDTLAQTRKAPPRTEDRRGLHREDQGVPAGSADHHRAGGPPARLRDGPHAAHLPRPHRRHAGRADVRQGHPPLLRGPRQGAPTARRCGPSARPRKAATWSCWRSPTRRRSSSSAPIATSSPQLTDPRKTTEAQAQELLEDGQADLLADQRHALARERRSRDAAGARLPADRAGDAVRPADPRQRHHLHHAGDRGGRPREAGRHLLLQQEARRERRAPAADVLGQVRRARQQPRRHGPVPRADPARHARCRTSGSRP